MFKYDKAVMYHFHIVYDNVDFNILDDFNYIKTMLQHTAKVINAVIIGETFYKFTPQGITGVISIAESHIAIHTFPECNRAFVDISTCSDSMDVEKGVDFIKKALGTVDVSIHSMVSG